MDKYYRSSFYWPDDKDIYDFLDGVNTPNERIRKLLRSFGVFVSPSAPRKELLSYVSLLYHDWNAANKVVSMATVRSAEDKRTNQNVKFEGSFNLIQSAVEDIRALRHDRDREKYTFIETTADTIAFTVDYIDVLSAATRLLQEREKTIFVQITRTQDGFKARYDNNPRAKQIVENILGKLEEQAADEGRTIEKNSIELSSLQIASLRVSFFKNLLTGIEGTELRDVVNVRMKKLEKPPENETNEKDADSDPDPTDDELEDALEKVIFYGKRLFTVPEFQKLVDKSFFIANAVWRAELATEKREHVELTAGFNDEGKDFSYKILGIYTRDDEGEIRATREHPPKELSETLLTKLEFHAEVTMKSLLKEAEERANE